LVDRCIWEKYEASRENLGGRGSNSTYGMDWS
jgi:hypothetical protein